MRRALILFMIVLLPFQWVWAAALTCAGESEDFTPQHVCDYVHKHSTEQTNAAADADQASLGGDHVHCGGAHLCADMGCTDDALQPFFEPTGAHLDTARLAFESHVPAGPERPDRNATP